MQPPRRLGALVVAASLGLAAPAFGQSTDAKEKTLPPPADAKHQFTSGVIVKAEPVAREGEPAGKAARRFRLTINTAAVWRDWARDQATLTPKSPRDAAAQGEKSIATTGEPIAPDNTVVVVVEPDTRVETRYRSPTDEATAGGRTPDGAARAEVREDPADTSKPNRIEPKGTRTPPRFTAAELKPGLFVEVQYRDAKTKEKATLVRVLRPVGGPDTPANDEKPAASPK